MRLVLAHVRAKLDDPSARNAKPFDYKTPDGYEFYLNLGPLANADKKYFKGKIAFWNDIMAHPNYDDWWQARTMRPHLKNVHAAVMTVGGWYDAEDLYGTLKTYQRNRAAEPRHHERAGDGPVVARRVVESDGDRLGNVPFDAKTSLTIREHIELPFFKHFLKDGRRKKTKPAKARRGQEVQLRRSQRVRNGHESMAPFRCLAAEEHERKVALLARRRPALVRSAHRREQDGHSTST